MPGSKLDYVAARDERGRARAFQVTYIGRRPASSQRAAPMATELAIAVLFAAFLLGLAVLEVVPGLLLAAYALLSGFAVLMYRADKAAAVSGGWRTSEATLHLTALLGGWPGALVARKAFRHKTTKEPFRTIFWCTVVANCAALALVVLDVPSALL